jgi:uncharacterized protein
MSFRFFVLGLIFLSLPLLGFANDRPPADTDYHESATADFGVWINPALWKIKANSDDPYTIIFYTKDERVAGGLTASPKPFPPDKLAELALRNMRDHATGAAIVSQETCTLCGRQVLRLVITGNIAGTDTVMHLDCYAGPEGMAMVFVAVPVRYADRYAKSIDEALDGMQIGKPGAQPNQSPLADAGAPSPSPSDASPSPLLTDKQVADLNETVPGTAVKPALVAMAQVVRGSSAAGIAALNALMKKGDPVAETFLGDCYMHGYGIPKDTARGLKLLTDAATKCPDAKYMLGALLIDGTIQPKDPVKGQALLRAAADGGYSQAEVAMGTSLIHTDPKAGEGWYDKAAEQGNPNGIYNLGLCYFQGAGIDKDQAKGLELLRSIAAKGYQGAQLVIARADLNHLSSSPDPAEGARYAQILAKAGVAEAEEMYGLCLMSGSGVPIDKQAAVDWIEKSADKNFAAAEDIMGQLYYAGAGVPKDINQAITWFQKASDAGVSDAQFRLGICYFRGDGGLLKDQVTAFDLLKKSAKGGNPLAEAAAATMILVGDTPQPPDYVQARTWAQDSVLRGDKRAAPLAAEFYIDGKGVPPDKEKAAYWFSKGAEAGDTECEMKMYSCYLQGYGVPKDAAKAAEWVAKAANQGRSDAQYQMGIFYVNGLGVAKDPAEAAKWFRFSAIQGDPRGENAYGYAIATGTGVPVDLVEAYKWFVLASSQDKYAEVKSRAQVNMGTFAPKMTLDQMGEARKRAKDFTPVKQETPGAADPFSIGVS